MKSNLRPVDWSESSTALDSRGDKFVDRKAVATAGATSNEVERLVEHKRVKFDLRASADLGEVEEEPVGIHRSLPRGVDVLHSSSIPSRVVTRQPIPSGNKTDIFLGKNLLPPTQIQEEVSANVSRRIASSRRTGD